MTRSTASGQRAFALTLIVVGAVVPRLIPRRA